MIADKLHDDDGEIGYFSMCWKTRSLV